jgi:hypothetical protein
MTDREIKTETDAQCAYLRNVADYARQITLASRGDGQALRLPEVDVAWKQRIFRNILGA